MGNTIGVDSSKGEYEGGRGMTDLFTSAGFGGSDESTGYDNRTDTFPEDEREKTDDSFPTEGINNTIGMLPNNDAVIAASMQPILRTVSTNNELLLRHGLQNCLC